LWASRGNVLQAVQYLSLALQLEPDFVAGHFALALQLERQGDATAAAAHFKWLLQPANGVAQSNPEMYQLANQKLPAS
jgi:hypothetical protein